MAGGIKIQFLADVRDFLRGTQDVEKSLDDVGDSLDDVAKEGDQATEKLEKSFKDLGKVAKETGKDLGDDLGKKVHHGADEASKGIDDFKENTKANLKETAASFGSVEDALGGIQGLASEALEGFGPAGVAAGAVAAIGIGVISSKLTEIADKTNEAAEAAAEWALAWRDAATDADKAQLLADGFDETAAKIGDARHAWEIWQKDAVTNAEQFASAIDQGALSVQDLQAAFTSTDPAERMDAGRKASKALADQLDRTTGSWQANSDAAFLGATTAEQVVGLTQDQTDALQGAKKAIDEKVKADEDAQRVLEAYAKASGLTVDAYLAQQQGAKDAADSLESYGQALEGIADPIESFNDALSKGGKKAKVTIATMIHDLEEKAAERSRFERNLRTLASKGGEALVDELRAAGPEAAGAVTSALAKGTGAQVRQYARLHAKAVGSTAGSAIGSGISSTNLAPSVQHAVDSGARRVKPPQVPIDVSADTRQFTKDIERAAAKEVTVRVNAKIRANPGMSRP